MSTIKVPLGGGYSAVIDTSDAEAVLAHKWTFWRRSYDESLVYAQTKIGGKNITMHRFLMSPGQGVSVDHRDGNGLNNTRQNLRVASHTQNMRNRKRSSRNKSGFKGVWQSRPGRWRTEIKKGGKRVFSACFNDPIAAARAYDKAAREHFGEFARCNFED